MLATPTPSPATPTKRTSVISMRNAVYFTPDDNGPKSQDAVWKRKRACEQQGGNPNHNDGTDNCQSTSRILIVTSRTKTMASDR